MSVRIDAAGDYFSRTSDFPQVDGFAVSMWFYMDTDRNAIGTLFTMLNGTGTVFQGLYLTSSGTTLVIDVNGTTVTGSELAAGNWYHLLYQRVGSAHTAYLNGALNITNTGNPALTTAFMLMGSNSVSFINGRLAAIKIWSGIGTAFTADEVVREMRSIRPQRFTNLHAWYPVFTGASERVKDYSGNGRTFGNNGTLTDEDGPPVSWGGASLLLPYAAAGGEITGSLSVTQASNTLSSVGVVDVVGTLAATQAANTLASAATADIIGNAAITQAGNTLSSAAVADIVGSASITQASNTVSSVGVLDIVGNVSITQAGNTLASVGVLDIVGTASITQAGNTLAATGAVDIVGALSVAQSANTLSSTGTTSDAITGDLAVAQASNTLVSAGVVDVIGTLTITQTSNTVVSTGTLEIVAGLSATQAGNTLSSVGLLNIVGSATLTQAGNTLSSTESAPITEVEYDALTVDSRTLLHTAEPRAIIWRVLDRHEALYQIVESRTLTETVAPRNLELKV